MRTLVGSQAIGALGMTIGLATASLVAKGDLRVREHGRARRAQLTVQPGGWSKTPQEDDSIGVVIRD